MLTFKIIAVALGAGLLLALFTDLTLEAALAIAVLISWGMSCAGPKPPNEQALTTPGEFGEQRRNKDADQEHAYDPKVHALIFALAARIVSYRPD
jgi:hypothetical protein